MSGLLQRYIDIDSDSDDDNAKDVTYYRLKLSEEDVGWLPNVPGVTLVFRLL